jgi:hypothetical protein
LADAQHQEGARLGDHAQVDLENGVAQVVPRIGVELSADPAENAHGVVVELLRAAGGGEHEQREAQQKPAEQAMIPDQIPLLRVMSA